MGCDGVVASGRGTPRRQLSRVNILGGGTRALCFANSLRSLSFNSVPGDLFAMLCMLCIVIGRTYCGVRLT